MDASILLVGSDVFRLALLRLLSELNPFSIEVAPNLQEALPLIQAQQPDLLLIQASQQGSLSLCEQIKSQNRLAWIYCFVLEDTANPAFQPRIDCSELVSENAIVPSVRQRHAAALAAGADAFLEVPLLETDPQGEWRALIRAQIQAGLRQVRTYRELIRTNDLLSAIALLDPLTELNNRRAFEWELPRQIQNARQREGLISLMMLDVDHFKFINDTYGHLVGDRALKVLAARLRHNLRFYDTPFRYGGEEFVLILNETGEQEVGMIANRLCQIISAQPFTIDETLNLKITVSIGAATLQPEDDPKGISLLQRADDRLLKAKSQGRNQVVSG
ncbi:GGDEF domain-containing protein [Leptolyngbya ohadii]|uniref:GGDEF domain-containing protein n=1 Tax=Leptolyngbya ohadii TaxID=1962290 RepID=UPI000B59DA33|nr:diguanylate cyclase [Leptolyngbya ohadii]